MTSEHTHAPWFQGTVSNAVERANSTGALLLVCLVQDSEPSSESGQFESRFKDDVFASALAELNIVSLKLVKDTPDGALFGQIFPIMIVPALYLIRNGMLTDFMNNTVDKEQMLDRILKAVDGHSQIPPPPSSIVADPPQSTAPTTPAPATPSSNPANETSSSPAPVSSPSPLPATPTAPAAIQAQMLKTLMEERKLKREKEERKSAKQRELDRRSSSKVLSSAQKELAEKQSKKLKDQIEKDKRDEAEYKKRVKQALEDDKAKRRAEREKALAAVAGKVQEEVVTPHEVRQHNGGLGHARNDAAPALACATSRLNIRLFDGSSIRNTFQATDTLEQVRDWINQNQEGDEKAYNIVQLIPSRTFTDESKMLRDLELCPSATLVLKRTATATSAYSGGAAAGLAPALTSYGWSALSMAGKLASSVYSTASYYNPLAASGSRQEGASRDTIVPDHTSESASSKKKDKETSYNGNSTSLE